MIGHSLYKSLSEISNKSKLFSYEIDSEMIEDNLYEDLIFENDVKEDTKHVNSNMEEDDFEIEYDKLIFDNDETNSMETKEIKEEISSPYSREYADDVLANVDVKEFNNLIFNFSQKELETSETNCNTNMTLLSNGECPNKYEKDKSKNSFKDFFRNLRKKGKPSPVDSPSKYSNCSGESTSINLSNNTDSFLKRKRNLPRENKKSYSLEEKNGEAFINISSTITRPFHTDIAPNSSLSQSSSQISIVSYNILNQIYMKKNGRDDLSLENRMKTIILELKNLNPDIICLQEADINVLKKYLMYNLPEYNLVYGVNCGSSFINVVGYKKEKFRLVSFKNFSLINIKVVGNRGAMNVILERNSLNRENISVYNVHFPWRHEMQRCEILEMLFSNIEENDIDNVLIVGDFNSEPYSLPIKLIYYNDFLKESSNDCDGKDLNLKKLWNNEKFAMFENVYRKLRIKSAYENYKKYLKHCKKEKGVNRNTDACQMDSSGKKSLGSTEKKRFRLKFKNGKKISTKLDFSYHSQNQNVNKKSYQKLDNRNFRHHPDITTCTAFYSNTIDYIFHSRYLKLTKILKLPDTKQIREEDFLPSVKFPSDHLKLFAQFELL
jgi:mRNA deadenylase 3'-5' endonuclease subunit Ccr4